MKKLKAGICGVMMAASLELCACSAHAQGTADNSSPTAKEVAECTMESLKILDLDRFNECTDNYVETYYNWIGMPIRSEYRVFNELLQPGVKIGKWKERYEFNQKVNEKMMENLAWKIKDVEEAGTKAEINMEITNLNMADVMGKYEISILENMIESDGTGLGQMIKDLSNITDEEDGLLTIIESCDKDDLSTIEVMVTAYRKNGAWQIHLDDEFINAFMGNIDAEEYSEDVQQRIEELEKLQNEKMDEWEEKFSDDVEKWMEGWF
ncbi:MAG: hypothetical protein K2J99_06950 [Lachnospiraceae bacterium]|nr:hypothetical protein [Lachnospiraceae bacterium]